MLQIEHKSTQNVGEELLKIVRNVKRVAGYPSCRRANVIKLTENIIKLTAESRKEGRRISTLWLSAPPQRTLR